jgi:hypothetical protein
MTESLNNYFKDGLSLDELSVTELEGLIEKYPFSSVYKMLLAKKMDLKDNHLMVLQSTDPTLNLYLKTSIPYILDENRIDDSNYIFYKEDESIDQFETEDIVSDQSLTEKKEVEEKPIEYIDTQEVGLNQKLEENISKIKKKKKKGNKFKLEEFAGISDFSKWLLAFKRDDVETKIRKEKKAAKKRLLKEKALKSVTKSKSIISEPLAEILASQGHLDDAKKMYEQLLLKYPEKSSYFAAKINNLIKL